MSVRRTRAIGRLVCVRRPARRPRRRALSAPVISTTRPTAALTTPGRQRHAHAALVLVGEVDRTLAVDHRIARRPRRGVPVGSHPEVDDVEALGQTGGVAPARPVEVGGGDGHEVMAAGEVVEVVGVAVRVAVGRDPLVDLPDADAVPRQVGSGEGGEHRRGRRAAGHGERRARRGRGAPRRAAGRWSGRHGRARPRRCGWCGHGGSCPRAGTMVRCPPTWVHRRRMTINGLSSVESPAGGARLARSARAGRTASPRACCT